MKSFEWFYLFLQPVYLPLHRQVRRELLGITKRFNGSREILDVGGRKSHYTIGLAANITISDLPRESAIQHQLSLGINDTIIQSTLNRRSNVRRIVFDDMASSSLPDGAFDCVVAVEVLEHVERDADFVGHVQRVLKPGGVFLMTTPNGDYLKKPNADHKRHYTRRQLTGLLSEYFDECRVQYAIKGGTFHRWGLKGWSPKRLHKTALSMLGNFVNSFESTRASIKERASGTHHLIAVAAKSYQQPGTSN
jgi:SAM-dependent methyltransferase